MNGTHKYGQDTCKHEKGPGCPNTEHKVITKCEV